MKKSTPWNRDNALKQRPVFDKNAQKEWRKTEKNQKNAGKRKVGMGFAL